MTMNLHETLWKIATDFNLDADELIRYADADEIGGYHTNPHFKKFECGAIWGVEGQIIYALVCALQPENILELGTLRGCSYAHMEAATIVNEGGVITTVDNAHNADFNMDAAEYLRTSDDTWDFVFEDTGHGVEITRDIWALAVQRLNPGGVIISHDAMHPTVGIEVRTGIERAGFSPKYYLTAPSDCGLAIWRKPLDTTVSTRKSVTKTPPRKTKSPATQLAAKRQAAVVKVAVDRISNKEGN